MSSRAELLAEKRRILQLRCAVEREELRYRHAEVDARLRSVDRAINLARGVVRHPVLIGGIMLGVAFIGPFKVLRWAGQSVFLWSALRRLGGYLFSRVSAANSAQ